MRNGDRGETGKSGAGEIMSQIVATNIVDNPNANCSCQKNTSQILSSKVWLLLLRMAQGFNQKLASIKICLQISIEILKFLIDCFII